MSICQSAFMQRFDLAEAVEVSTHLFKLSCQQLLTGLVLLALVTIRIVRLAVGRFINDLSFECLINDSEEFIKLLILLIVDAVSIGIRQLFWHLRLSTLVKFVLRCIFVYERLDLWLLVGDTKCFTLCDRVQIDDLFEQICTLNFDIWFRVGVTVVWVVIFIIILIVLIGLIGLIILATFGRLWHLINVRHRYWYSMFCHLSTHLFDLGAELDVLSFGHHEVLNQDKCMLKGYTLLLTLGFNDRVDLFLLWFTEQSVSKGLSVVFGIELLFLDHFNLISQTGDLTSETIKYLSELVMVDDCWSDAGWLQREVDGGTHPQIQDCKVFLAQDLTICHCWLFLKIVN